MSPVTGDINGLTLHPEHPNKAWVVIEQPKGERLRFAYDPVARQFHTTDFQSLIWVRKFSGAYGWIGGSGLPPDPHFDVLLSPTQYRHSVMCWLVACAGCSNDAMATTNSSQSMKIGRGACFVRTSLRCHANHYLS